MSPKECCLELLALRINNQQILPCIRVVIHLPRPASGTLLALLGALNAAQPVSVRRVVGNPDFASFLHDQLHCFSAHAQVHFELGAHNR